MSAFSELSAVETAFVEKSGRKATYPGERVSTVEVQNVYDLGKIVSLRFIEWCWQNPRGNIALPTGRTPEFFIKTLEKYRSGWSNPEVQAELRSLGLPEQYLGSFPDTSGLNFFMLDEFFPMLPTHRNSFCKYIKAFYCEPLGIPAENIHTFDLVEHGVLTTEELQELTSVAVIDLSLLTRAATNAEEESVKDKLTKAQTFCEKYEEKLKKAGGIGFFLGGIGPDGHVAFNQQGGPHDSRTRLVNFNYPSAAAAAGDLGGIEIARGKAAMTIGLATICDNPDATIIIMASGEGKATVVRDAIEKAADPERPATVLHAHKGARFYLTHGAAMKLSGRLAEKVGALDGSVIKWAGTHMVRSIADKSIGHMDEPTEDYQLFETLVYNASLQAKKPVAQLSLDDLLALPEAKSMPAVLKAEETFKRLIRCADNRLREKVEGGLRACRPTEEHILHTAPHHDDIMLSYHAAMHEMLGRKKGIDESAPLGEAVHNNKNHFAYLTSGFHSVNDPFLRRHVNTIRGDGDYAFLRTAVDAGEVFRDYDALMADFRRCFWAKDAAGEARVESLIFIRKVEEVFVDGASSSAGDSLFSAIREGVEWVRTEYLDKHTPGDAVPLKMQLLKGCMRESEVDRVWALSRMPMDRVHHLRSKFYTDDFFTPMPSVEGDAMPMADLIKRLHPQMLSVAFDPEGTGPDTHYKVLQVVAAGLRISKERGDLSGMKPPPVIWGYRNVWFVFHPADATLFIPGSQDDLDLMHDTFMSCFTTQKAASFPSPYYDGPFSGWARQLQKEQCDDLRTLLGEEYFKTHPDARIRNCSGFVFIKAMHLDRFLQEVEDLKSKFEL